MDNLILIDWVSISFKHLTVGDVKRLIGMEQVPWMSIKGAHGYSEREYYDGVSIHHTPHESQQFKVWLEMSGQGCRAFESYGAGNFEQLLNMAATDTASCHITRLDVAFDDHNGLLDIHEISRKVHAGEYTSLASWWECTDSSQGTSVYIGSPRSNVRIRFYDKAAERKVADKSEHWVRVELQLRDENALGFVNHRKPVGEKFRGVMRRYLQFREPTGDRNKARWPISPWYEKFFEGVKPLSIYTQLGVDYNILRTQDYVINQAGNSIDTLIKCVGNNAFLDLLHKRKVRRNPRYDQIVADYRAAAKEPIRAMDPRELLRQELPEAYHAFTDKQLAYDDHGVAEIKCACCGRVMPAYEFRQIFASMPGVGVCRDCVDREVRRADLPSAASAVPRSGEVNPSDHGAVH